jgi:hypothetical protein
VWLLLRLLLTIAATGVSYIFYFLSRPPLLVRRPKPTLVSFPYSNYTRLEANCFVLGKGVDATRIPLFILLSKSL